MALGIPFANALICYFVYSDFYQSPLHYTGMENPIPSDVYAQY
jgi:hypothetical protein